MTPNIISTFCSGPDFAWIQDEEKEWIYFADCTIQFSSIRAFPSFQQPYLEALSSDEWCNAKRKLVLLGPGNCPQIIDYRNLVIELVQPHNHSHSYPIIVGAFINIKVRETMERVRLWMSQAHEQI